MGCWPREECQKSATRLVGGCIDSGRARARTILRQRNPPTAREYSAHYTLVPSVDFFAEVLFSHGHVRNQYSPQLSVSQIFGIPLAASNPFNPFGEDVNVSFAYPGTGLTEVVTTSEVRPMLGARGSVFSEWHYEVTTYLSQNRLRQLNEGYDFQNLADTLASYGPETA